LLRRFTHRNDPSSPAVAGFAGQAHCNRVYSELIEGLSAGQETILAVCCSLNTVDMNQIISIFIIQTD
jgi:hypothetical protein